MTNIEQRLKIHLLKGRTITGLEALRRWGTIRLASYVERLRRKGYVVKTVMVTKGNKSFAKYHL